MSENFLPPMDDDDVPMSLSMHEKLMKANEMFAKYDTPPDIEAAKVETQAMPIDPSTFRPAYQSLETVSKPSGNPLQKYFRKPGTWVGLPSGGCFYEDGFIQLNTLKQVAVQPMSADDELMLQNPDALFNGEAIKHILESCIPGLKDANELLTPDVDVLMLAIRVATFGNELEMESDCPNCETKNKYAIDVRNVLGKIKTFGKENIVQNVDGLSFYLKPYNYMTGIKIAIATYEEMKFLQNFTEESEEYQKNIVRETMKRLKDFTRSLLPNGIVKITTPDNEEVHDIDFIQDFIANTDARTIKTIEDGITNLNNSSIDKDVEVDCMECGHKWNASISFDPARFFV